MHHSWNCPSQDCPHSKYHSWDFPGGPVVKTLPFDAEGAGLIPSQGAKISGLSADKPKH